MMLPLTEHGSASWPPFGSYTVFRVSPALLLKFQFTSRMRWASVWLSVLLTWTTNAVEFTAASAAGTDTAEGRRLPEFAWASGEPIHRVRVFLAEARPEVSAAARAAVARIAAIRRPWRRVPVTDVL